MLQARPRFASLTTAHQRKKIGQNLPYLKWILSQGNSVSALVQHAEDATAAFASGNFAAGWTAVKAAGDLLVPMLSTFPGTSPSTPLVKVAGHDGCFLTCDSHCEYTDEDVDALLALPAVGKNGVIIGKIVDSLPQILSFIQGLMKFFPMPA